jgi:hypothetical protein
MSGERMAPFRLKMVCLIAALVILLPATSFSQSSVSGTISGIITDASGAVIPGVKVTLTNTGTQQTAVATTNASGFYTFPNLPAGNYNVEAERHGFQRCENTGVHLDPAGNIQLTCVMKVGEMTQSVQVKATTVHVQVNDAKVGRIVNSEQMQQLPVNGRNFVSLFALQPGVTQSFAFNSFQGTSLFASQCTHVNGLTGESNAILIDGAPSTRTRANGAIVAPPSLGAISEVNIVTNSYMPEYSRAAGGQIVVNMKSGADTYHGEVFEFLRNDALNARNFFSTSIPKLDLNDFGFDFGGQVIPKHHKLYFYWAEEWIREISGHSGVSTVPSLLDRAGDFTNYCLASPKLCPVVPAYLNGVDGLVASQRFPNDTVPQSLWSPNGSAMAHLYLPPNTTGVNFGEGSNFLAAYNSVNNQREDDIKIDYLPTERNHLGVTLRHYTEFDTNPAASGQASLLLDQERTFPERGATFDLTSTLSPTLLNDFTATATEDIVHVNVPKGGPAGNGLNRTGLGITYPYILGDASKDIPGKIPTVLISGFDTISGLPYPSGSVGHIYTLQDVVTKISGNHTFKTGVWWEHDGENDHDQVRVTPGGGVGNNLNGQFQFAGSNPNTTHSPYADALLGNFDNYSELGWRDYTPWHAFQFGVFGQDSWKVTPRFTLQGGLRWDYFQPYRSAWCNFSMFSPLFYSNAPGVQPVVDPTTGEVVSGNPYDGIAVPCTALPNSAIGHFAVFGQPVTAQNISFINAQLRDAGMLRGLTPSIIGSQYKNFQPRLGFAWDPTGHGTTAIRAGGGIFYNHNTLSDVTLMGGNTPFQTAVEVFNGSADNPGVTPGARLPIPMTGADLVNKTPVVYQWSFTVEHMFAGNTLVDVGYVGDQARNEPMNADLNQPPIGTFNSPANKGINPGALRPFPGIGGAQTTLQEGSSGYNSLQVSVQRRFTNGLQYGVAYTYSKTMDNMANGSSIYAVATDTYDPGYNWALADFDRTHSLIFTYVYDLPFLKNNHTWIGKTVGGWELSGDVALLSGFPTSVTASGDPLGNGVNLVSGQEYATLVSGCAYKGNRSFNKFFNTACFQQPTSPTLAGTAPRNLIRRPGTDNWDLGLFKNGPITERLSYQFRAEFFNVLNHPSFNGVSTGVTSGNFGRITGVNDPREIQLALKLSF